MANNKISNINENFVKYLNDLFDILKIVIHRILICISIYTCLYVLYTNK